MHLVSLTEFLTFGSLGGIRCGLTPAEVESACGSPSDISTPSFPRTWAYGGLQFTFVDNHAAQREELALIGVYFHVRHEPLFGSNQAIEATGWWPTAESSYDEFVGWLRSQDIEWSLNSELTFETQTTLRVRVGVLICFNKERSAHLLDSIQYCESENPQKE